MEKPKRKKPKFSFGEVVALRIKNEGITEYGIVAGYDDRYQYRYGIQLSSYVGITWRPARDLRPLSKRERGQ